MFKYSKKERWVLSTMRERHSWRLWVRLLAFNFRLQISTRFRTVGFSFHTGMRHSETPIDVHVGLYFIAFFWSFDWPGLGRFCEWLGRRHKRNISLEIHNYSLWWNLWYDDDGGNDAYHKHDKWKQPVLPPWRWGRKKYRSWLCLRQGSIALNPLDAFWGHRLYHYVTVDSHISWVQCGTANDLNDMHLVELELQKTDRFREHGPKWLRGRKDEGYTVHWDCRKGIPTKSHDRGRIMGSAFSLKQCQIPTWKDAAVETLPRRIGEMRVRNNYQKELT